MSRWLCLEINCKYCEKVESKFADERKERSSKESSTVAKTKQTSVSASSISHLLKLYLVQLVLCIITFFMIESLRVWSKVDNWIFNTKQRSKMSAMSKAEVKTERVPPDNIPKVDSENCSCEKVEKSRNGRRRNERKESVVKEKMGVVRQHVILVEK